MRDAIFRRSLSYTQNACDYVSLLFRLEKWQEGYRILIKLEDDKDNEMISFLKGIYFLKMKDLLEAERSFINVINISPNDGASLNNLGAINLINGKIKDGKMFLLKAIELYPNYFDANYNLQMKAPYTLESVRFTWRKLRSKLISYSQQ
ncbi:hypothetical protein NST12_13890 [Bacillus sp. FSL W8-1127]|uniref:tetratricopeptide repeat protein n=1 Tax=Bacillus sp. FSL W8-1127 TaxID=2954710 RepID=UPI0030FC8775